MANEPAKREELEPKELEGEGGGGNGDDDEEDDDEEDSTQWRRNLSEVQDQVKHLTTQAQAQERKLSEYQEATNARLEAMKAAQSTPPTSPGESTPQPQASEPKHESTVKQDDPKGARPPDPSPPKNPAFKKVLRHRRSI